MTVDKSNILVGPVRLLLGIAADATVGTPDVLPADTVALGASWGGSWRDLGWLTDAGIRVHFESQWTAVMGAQSKNAAIYLPGAINDFFSGALLETTLINLRDAMGRGTITTVAPGGSPGHDQLSVDTPTQLRTFAVGYEWVAPPNTKRNPQRGIIPIAMATGSLEFNATNTAVPANYPVTFTRCGDDVLSTPIVRNILTT